MSATGHGLRLRRIFKNVTAQKVVVTTEDPATDSFIAGKAGYSLCIQRVWLNIGTSAAKTITVQTDDTTPVVIASIATPAVGEHLLFDSEEGFQVTAGKNVDIVTVGGAGLGGILIVEGYLKPTGTIEPSGI